MVLKLGWIIYGLHMVPKQTMAIMDSNLVHGAETDHGDHGLQSCPWWVHESNGGDHVELTRAYVTLWDRSHSHGGFHITCNHGCGVKFPLKNTKK